jgi:DNA-binding NarL/FixJ family response regulator
MPRRPRRPALPADHLGSARYRKVGLRIPTSTNATHSRTCKALGMPIRCLIVDDNRSFLDAARELLERQGMTVVGVALTSDEAIGRAELLRPDVILVDVSLGEESGFDLTRRLVEKDRRNGAAIVLISTRSEDELADLIEESPALGFVPKTDLSATAVRRLIERRAG